MKTRYLLGALAGCCLASLPLSAQTFVGSDNFDTGSAAKWDLVYRLNGATQGSLSFTNGRLDFEKSAGLGNQFRLWDSDGTASASVVAPSFTTSWMMTMTVTNTLTGIASGEFATIGIQVFNDDNSYSALMLNTSNGGNFVRAEGNGFTTVSSATADTTDVTLRLSWDATAQTLGAAYSLDGSTFNAVATFHPVTEWPGTTTANGFNFGVFGNSNLSGAISVGSVYADNFSVSAVPEPSTYAAFAGLGALGLVWWRRRPRATAAVKTN